MDFYSNFNALNMVLSPIWASFSACLDLFSALVLYLLPLQYTERSPQSTPISEDVKLWGNKNLWGLSLLLCSLFLFSPSSQMEHHFFNAIREL